MRPHSTSIIAGCSTDSAVGARRPIGGFTMIEIAIALGVIGFALVAIIGILPSGLEVQRDNRAETIINQDGMFWIEAIRNGAQGLDELVSQVERITITNRVTATENTYAGFTRGDEIISLLTSGATNADLVVRAYVWSLTGSAAEKEPNTANREVTFKYRMEVRIEPATQFTVPFSTGWTNHTGIVPDPLTSLYSLHLVLAYPVVANRQPPRAQSYRALISRNLMTNYVAFKPYVFFTQ